MLTRKSRQRAKILELLRSTKIHPTAGWIYDKLKHRFPSLSLGTVYRNLNILVGQGLVNKVEFGSTFDRFDANITEHQHFICKKCGSITDIDLAVSREKVNRIEAILECQTERQRIDLYGVCKKCRKGC